MDLGSVTRALNSNLRRKILQILALRSMTSKEVFEQLGKEDFQIKYRETVYRALEKLVNADLVEKYYEQGKGI